MNSPILSLPTCDPAELEVWAAKLRVCGHPMRWRILCLIEHQSACVTDLWQCLDQPQPVISQHLSALKERGIVEASVVGNKRLYQVIDPLVQTMVRAFLAKIEGDAAVGACLA